MIPWRKLAPLLICLAALIFVVQFRPGQSAATQASPVGSKTWVGRYHEFEEYLRTAECVLIEAQKSSQGIPTMMRCVLRPGGPVARMLWKSLYPGVYRGFRESYKSEIAAYELDKLLKMDMVPPAVERDLQGHTGAAVLWVENIVAVTGESPSGPDRVRWGTQRARMSMFYSLIGNEVRNPDMLRDGAWNLILIDHSQAFGSGTELPSALDTIDQWFWGRIAGLTRKQLEARLRPWLDDDQITAIMARRERMRAAIERPR